MSCLVCAANYGASSAATLFVAKLLTEKSIEYLRLTRNIATVLKLYKLDLVTENEFYELENIRADVFDEIEKLKAMRREYQKTATLLHKQADTCVGC